MKILILRFSSYGDILQALIVLPSLKKAFPHSEIHWATRLDMKELMDGSPLVEKVWGLDRKAGFKGLVNLTSQLLKENYTHVYDAHNSLRSLWICFFLLGVLRWKVLFRRVKFIRRSSQRIKRFLLFKFRFNLFEKPLIGRKTFLVPLKAWIKNDKNLTSPFLISRASFPSPFLIKQKTLEKVKSLLRQNKVENFIALAPSASLLLKKWPLGYWQELINQLPQFSIVILGGGKKDAFLKTLKRKKKVNENALFLNLTNHLSFTESLSVIKHSRLLISADTGLLHGAEYLRVPAIALIGPSAFGYPSEKITKVLHLHLKCSPCSAFGRGPCVNPYFQQCLRDIQPQDVAIEVQKKMNLNS